ncbi:MAG: hypothetical protein G01um101420_386 [Parcubacteria group bacterium Gr01-1014_20]|nr:MAG: hypothetical protein G01um101420_386 [Parcubacteria group bacterium Gr01-1014_20]
MPKDYYKTLGVSKSASEEEIKKAYRKLAHEHHPDKKGGDEKKFKEINEAYQILSDKNKRSNYDRFGAADSYGQGFGGNPGGSWGGFPGNGPGVNWDGQFYGDAGDFSEIFDNFFEGLGVKPRRKTYHRGADIEVGIEITLEEAFRGAIKHVKIKTLTRCEECKGKGGDEKAGYTTCSVCAGQGEIKEQSRTFFGSFYQVKNCVPCRGTGQIPNKICRVCRGNGRVEGERQVTVEILPGIENDQLIKITGSGEAGERGAGVGDLYFRIRIKPHDTFFRRGEDLVIRKELNILDLLIGKKIEVSTIAGGKLNLEIPPHFNLKEDLKIKGEGMPRIGNFGRGDLLVSFVIKAPKKINPEIKKLLEGLEQG